MAIDQEIQQRVDTYRNNPQALQQRYAQNQQLLDLLALQRLKTEKDEAARKVQMEMAQNPQTIKQQREQQLLDMTKQEMAQQTAGIMQLNQQQQQKNMQQVAAKGAATPQQVQQVASGLGALAQQQSPPVKRMAEGGAVEPTITPEMIAAYRKKLGNPNISDEDIIKILSREMRGESAQPPASMSDEDMLTAAETTESMLNDGVFTNEFPGVDEPPAEAAPEITLEEAEAYRNDAGPMLQGMLPDSSEGLRSLLEGGDQEAPAPAVPSAPPTAEATKPPTTPPAPPNAQAAPPATPAATPTAPGGIMELLQRKENQLSPPTIDTSAQPSAGDILETAGLGTLTSPEEARTSARDDSAAYLQRGEKQSRMNAYLDELKAFDVRQQDPNKLRNEQISAFMRGTAGKRTFGETMAGGSEAMAKTREAQEKAQRDSILKRIDLAKSVMDMDTELAKTALNDGRSAYEQAMANRRQAAEVLSSTRSSDVQQAIEQANMEFEANKNNVSNLLSAAQIKYTDELRRALQESEIAQRDAQSKAANAQRAGQMLADMQKLKVEVFREEVESDTTLRAAQIALAQNPDDPKAKAVYTAAYKAVQNRVNAYFSINVGGGKSLNHIESVLMKMVNGEQVPSDGFGILSSLPANAGVGTGGADFSEWGELITRELGN